LHTETIGLFFGAATELHECPKQTQPGSILVNQAWPSAQEDRAGQGGIFKQSAFRLVFNRVTCSHMPDLMSHDAGHLRFVIRGQYQTLVHIKEATGQSESIHLV